MELKQEETTTVLGDRLQNIFRSLSQCKRDFLNEREDCKKVREINGKLDVELKEARELEKSHRYQLLMSREMIGNLQETVSQLVYLRRDIRKLKDEIMSKDLFISATEREKDNIIQKHNENIKEMMNAHDKLTEELTHKNERQLQQVQHHADTQIAQFTCVIEELRSKIKELETSHSDKMNIVVLEYEEKIQRSAAQVTQLQEQLARQAACTDANINAYRRRLDELEEKLKQNQFKQYLAQSSYSSQYESQVERPYSDHQVIRDPYSHTCPSELEPILEISKPKASPTVFHGKVPKSTNSLQVMYYGNKTPNVQKNCDKKGQFNITKKRKLYNEKDFQDF